MTNTTQIESKLNTGLEVTEKEIRMLLRYIEIKDEQIEGLKTALDRTLDDRDHYRKLWFMSMQTIKEMR